MSKSVLKPERETRRRKTAAELLKTWPAELFLPSREELEQLAKGDGDRKAGDTLRVMKDRGEITSHGGDRKSKSQVANLISFSDMGIDKDQSARFQQPAAVPEVNA